MEISDWKNNHINETVVIFGTGKTLSQFQMNEIPLNCIKIGVNHVPLKRTDIILDYYFFGDRRRITPELVRYRPRIQGFCQTEYNGKRMAPQLTLAEAKSYDAIPFKLGDSFHKDISMYPCKGDSIIFPAVQFALYMGASSIILVGCDADAECSKILTRSWIPCRDFIKKGYPNVNVSVIRPRGLISLFNTYNEAN